MKKPEDAIFSSLLFNLEFLYHRRKKGRKKKPGLCNPSVYI